MNTFTTGICVANEQLLVPYIRSAIFNSYISFVKLLKAAVSSASLCIGPVSLYYNTVSYISFPSLCQALYTGIGVNIDYR